MEKKVPIEVSARHVHLSQEDLEALFGEGYELKKLKDLKQPGDFAAKETLDIISGGRRIEGVRIVGPVREKTQVELSKTDALYLKIEPSVRMSGRVEGTPGAVLKSVKGEVEIKEGLIIPLRHLHCSIEEAEEFGLKDDISVRVGGVRSVTFHNVKVRAEENYRLSLHIDTDEGNAAGINKEEEGDIL